MTKKASAPLIVAVVVVLSVLFAVLVPHVVAFLNAEVFHRGEVSVVGDPGHGNIEIWALENGAWKLIINTTSEQTSWVPANTTLLVSAKPAYGFQFYELNYTTNVFSNSWSVWPASDMQSIATLSGGIISGSVGAQPGIEVTVSNPSVFKAVFPAEIQFSPAYIYDTDYNMLYNVTFLGQLTFVANGSPVPNAQSLAPYLSYLNIVVVGEENDKSYPASFPLSYSPSGNYFEVVNQEVANIGSGNYADGLKSKQATITFSSPDPTALASGTVFSATNWGWGDTFEFTSGNSQIIYTWYPFSNVAFTGTAPYNKTAVTYFPTGQSLTFQDFPAIGYVFTQWYEEVKNSQGGFQVIASSTANPWTISTPTTAPAPNYVYYINPSITETSISFTIDNTVDVSIQGGLYIYYGSSVYYIDNFQLSPSAPGSEQGTSVSFTLSKVPEGSYTWNISPSSGTYTSWGQTFTYSAFPSSGSFNISASSPSFGQTVAYGSNVKYATVTFESNLPSGVFWWVDFGGTNKTSTSPTISFSNVPYTPNGGVSYSWSAPAQVAGSGSLSGYIWKTSSFSGTIAVTGNTTQSITYTEYAVVEISVSPSGAGTVSPTQALVQVGQGFSFYFYPNLGWWYKSVSWSPSSSTSLVSVSKGYSGGEPNFYITMGSVWGPVNVTVNAKQVYFTVYFEDYAPLISQSFNYSVEITKSGSLIANGSAKTGSKISFEVLASTVYGYTYENASPQSGIEDVPTGAYSTGSTVISNSNSSGTFEITQWSQNNSVVVEEEYTEYDYVTVSVNPSGAGTVSPGSGWYQYHSQQTFTATANQGWYFESWSTDEKILTGSATTSPSIEITGPGSLTANFNPITLTFTESGLPSGAMWNVTISGPTTSSASSYSSTITFNNLPAGTYSYSISVVSYGGNMYVPSPSSGSVSVSTTSSVSVSFSEAYAVTLQVSGSGTISWSQASGTVISSSGATSGSTSSSTTIYMTSNAQVELNASAGSGYYFSDWSFSEYVSPAQGYSTRDNPTYAVDSGGSGTVTANFASTTYSYTWSESGLVSGDSATLTVNGKTYTLNSSQTSVTVSGLKGSVSWSVSNSQYGATPSPSSGTVSSSGSTTISFSYQPLSVSLGVSPSITAEVGQTLTFTGSISGGSGSYSWTLSFGDGNSVSGTGSSVSKTHSYSSPGTYTATLSAKDTKTGATGSASITITVNKALSASLSASPTSGYAPLSVTFTVSLSGGSGAYYVTIYFGDGNSYNAYTTSNTFTYNYTYQNTGSFSAYATVEDYNDQSVSVTTNTVSISVQQRPSTYSVTFEESGLPEYETVHGNQLRVSWSVVVNGTSYSADVPNNITVPGLSGTVNWKANDVYVTEGTKRVTYYPNPSSGSVSSAKTISITYKEEDPPAVPPAWLQALAVGIILAFAFVLVCKGVALIWPSAYNKESPASVKRECKA